MKDILETIVADKRVEVRNQKEGVPPSRLHEMVEALLAEDAHGTRSMRGSLLASRSGIISEFKRKSPSKGWIHEDARVEDVVPLYSAGGAAAISILTDEKYFGGNLRFVQKVRGDVDTPILRKDFIIDEYQLFQARMAGADAVLLIAACLQRDECRSLAHTARELGLETLLEVHSERELEYVGDDIDMVGVNNRNLGTFHTDVSNSFRLAECLPKDYVLVSESGIDSAATIRELRGVGFRGFLIGEALMKTDNPGESLARLIKEIEG